MLDPSAILHAALRRLPEPIQTRAVALAVNHLLKGQALAGRLDELSGKRFRLCVEDVPVALTFEIRPGGLRRTRRDPDVTMRGALRDFVALARREQDPDTLFFQRRLVVEGETETGLHLKNLLDGWDYDVPAHVHAVLPAPLARITLAGVHAARSLHELSRLHRPGSRRNSRPAGRAPAS